jgi:hypothetical protein
VPPTLVCGDFKSGIAWVGRALGVPSRDFSLAFRPVARSQIRKKSLKIHYHTKVNTWRGAVERPPFWAEMADGNSATFTNVIVFY